jgi:hypothetical protein
MLDFPFAEGSIVMSVPSGRWALRCRLSLLAFLAVCRPALAQSVKPAPCAVVDIGTPTLPACVVHSGKGVQFVPKRYWLHAVFNRYGLAPFTIESFGRVYIDRSGRIVIRDVALMDNGPDEFHHGLIRVHRDDMWGYADSSGRLVVPVKYSCALNSADIGPLVCVGCHDQRAGEYTACRDGQWFRTDAKGKLSPSPAP